ncbi:MAG: helix-turn-helix domain-containing protein [Peptostreptococcaceae bacterium]
MSFGERLKELRVKNNVTQQELADYIGVGRPSIAGYETKSKHPDYDKLRLIAQFFNVTTDYLLEISDTLSSINEESTIATHREEYGEDLPEEARKELDEFISYLKFKYKDNE